MDEHEASVGDGSMSRNECPCYDMEPINESSLQIFLILATFACLFILICKTKSKRRISVDLSD